MSDKLIFLIPIVIGVIWIYGTAKNRWKALINPTTDNLVWLFYGPAFIKKLFGEDALRIFNYAIGSFFIVFGILCVIFK